jgi:hypothetical protein
MSFPHPLDTEAYDNALPPSLVTTTLSRLIVIRVGDPRLAMPFDKASSFPYSNSAAWAVPSFVDQVVRSHRKQNNRIVLHWVHVRPKFGRQTWDPISPYTRATWLCISPPVAIPSMMPRVHDSYLQWQRRLRQMIPQHDIKRKLSPWVERICYMW